LCWVREPLAEILCWERGVGGLAIGKPLLAAAALKWVLKVSKFWNSKASCGLRVRREGCEKEDEESEV
jgi:hypothetical protein